MSRYPSHTGQLMYGVEGSYGSEAAASLYVGRYTNSTFTANNNLIKDYDAGDRSVKNLHVGQFTGRGSVSFDIIDFSIFQYIFGARTGSGTSGAPYVYTVGSTLSSLTFEQGFNSTTDTNWTYIGCMCNSATITFGKNKPLRCRSEWFYQTEKEDATIIAYTAPTTMPYSYLQGSLERTNSAIAAVQSGSFTIGNSLTTDDDCFSRLILGLYVGQSDISFEFVVNMDSDLATTLWSDMYGQAVASGPISTGTGILAGATFDLELDNGSVRDTTLAFSVSTIESMSRPHDIGNEMVQCTFKGTSKTLTITEQDSA